MKKFTKMGLYIVLVLALVYFSVNLVMFLLIRQGEEVVVPDLTGIAVQDAYDRLTAIDLFLVKDGEQYSATVTGGGIISQNPLPGSKVKAGRKIRVIISRGSEKVNAPDVTSKTWRDAEIILRQAGLSIGETLRVYSVKDMDTVVLQDPVVGTSVEKGSPVNLVVSAGPVKDGSVMPNLLSRSYNQVDRIIKLMGLKIGKVSTEVNDNIDSGTVLRQVPDPNSSITVDTPVELTISIKSGEELASPTVKMLHYEVAQGLLEKRVRILVTDEQGEREAYNQTQTPGSKVNLAVTVKGKASAKIYVNEILAEERQLQ